MKHPGSFTTSRAFRSFALAAALVPGLAIAAIDDALETRIGDLSDADWHVRAAAAAALGDSRSANRTVVDALKAALADDDSRVRRSAAVALGDIGPAASRAVPALVAAFDDIDPGVIAAAADALGRMGSRASRATPELSTLLDHADERVRVAAASALGGIGARARAGAPQLAAQLDDADAGVRIAAAEALGAMGRRASGSTSRLVQLLGDDDAGVRAAASAALVSIGKDAVPTLVRALEKGDPVFLEAVVATLGDMGATAVPVLVDRLHDRGSAVLAKRYSAMALARIGTADRRVVPALGESLAADQPDVRVAALEALARIGPPAAGTLPTVVGLATDQRQPAEVRLQAYATMGRLAPDSAEVRETLVAAVGDSDPRVYEAAVAALVGLQSGDAATSADGQRPADLARRLRDGPSPSRLAAAQALGEMGRFGAVAVPDLAAVLSDPHDEALRVASARALGLIGPEAESAVPALIRALQDASPALRDSALVALDRIGPQTQTIPALLEAMRSGDLESRASAARKVRGFVRARMATWDPLVGQADAPVLRNWLARHEAVYGVAVPHDVLTRNREADDSIDYFDVLGGRAALRESMQLELIANPFDVRDEPRRTPVEDIPGVDVASHPFDEMLEAGDGPIRRVPLAEIVPQDRFFAWFRDIAALRAAMAGMAEQFLRMESALAVKSVDYGLGDRYLARLGLSAEMLDRAQLSGAIRDLAIVAPDLFFVDGTDITVIASLASPQVTATVLDLLGLQAPTSGSYTTQTLDNGDEVYWTIRGGLLFIGTSTAELDRVLALQHADGRDSLGRSDEFRYMQRQVTIESGTDAYLYFSDAFIRRLVGPALKIGQLRRMQARAEMEMLVSGALLYLLDGNRHVPGIEQLVRYDYIPGHFANRDYDIDDSLRGSSATWGSIANLEPLGANPVDRVTDRERDAYGRFVADYSAYWRQFFDPIAIRIDGIGEDVTEVTTFILPLPESGLFDQVRNALATNETGQRLEIPTLDPVPTLVLSLNLNDNLRVSLSQELADLLVRYTAVEPGVFDSIGSGVHLAVLDSLPIVALGGGDIWGALDKDMLRLDGFDSLLPLLVSLATQPSTVLVELEDPDRVAAFLAAAVVTRAGNGSPGVLHKLQDQDAWIYTLDIEGLLQIHLRIEIEHGYLMVSNLPWSPRLRIAGSTTADMNGAVLRVNLDEFDQQLPALHTKVFADYRAAAVDGMGYLYPLLVAGVADDVPSARVAHARIFGFRPVHPSSGAWAWRDSYLVSSQFGTASYPVQPEHAPGDRDFGLFPRLSVLSAGVQFEDSGLRAVIRWQRRP